MEKLDTIMEKIDIPAALHKVRADPMRIIGFGVASILFMLVVNYIQGNGLADGFAMVGGINKRSFSLLGAKISYLRGGRDMMYAAMAKLGKGFYVCTLEGPVSFCALKIHEVKIDEHTLLTYIDAHLTSKVCRRD
jgi:hypothetical protein